MLIYTCFWRTSSHIYFSCQLKLSKTEIISLPCCKVHFLMTSPMQKSTLCRGKQNLHRSLQIKIFFWMLLRLLVDMSCYAAQHHTVRISCFCWDMSHRLSTQMHFKTWQTDLLFCTFIALCYWFIVNINWEPLNLEMSFVDCVWLLIKAQFDALFAGVYLYLTALIK